MGFLKKLKGFFQRKNEYDTELVENDSSEIEAYEVDRSLFDLENPQDRENYVRSLLDQISDTKGAVKAMSAEYQSVSSYLSDIEELDALPKEERMQLLACCKSLQNLENARNANPIHKGAMSDEEFHRIESAEDELLEGVQKLRETEDYQDLIHHDLRRLDAEHQAYVIHRKELAGTMLNLKTIVKVGLAAMVICVFALLMFQFYLGMDTKIGYILIALLTAGVLTFVFVKYKDSDAELDRVNRNLDKLILLQNRVKIRYVNNTNLLDYYYLKYGFDSAAKLEKKIADFRKERELRKEYAKVMEDLDFFQKDMLRLLRKYNLYDPTIWLYQYDALLDPKEMVEIRHKYNVRRQKLRKQIETNESLADRSMEEIRAIVLKYKEDSRAILALLDEYEAKAEI